MSVTKPAFMLIILTEPSTPSPNSVILLEALLKFHIPEISSCSMRLLLRIDQGSRNHLYYRLRFYFMLSCRVQDHRVLPRYARRALHSIQASSLSLHLRGFRHLDFYDEAQISLNMCLQYIFIISACYP